MLIHSHADLHNRTTFNLKASSRYLALLENDNDCHELRDFISDVHIPSQILGGGSNTLFCSDYPGVVAIMTNSDITRLSPTRVCVDAGVQLDDFVLWAVKNGLSGSEALSGIPGTIGGAIALNAGAYGQCIKDILHSVTVFDLERSQFLFLSVHDLHYWHRSSIFRDKRGQNWVIVRAEFKLKTKFSIPDHPKVATLPSSRSNSPEALREGVLTLRSHIPNPNEHPNAGSFFLNPTIPNSVASVLQKQFPDIAMRRYDAKHFSISAGWLLDNLGLRGTHIGPFTFHHKHANFVINTSEYTTGKDVWEFISLVQIKVKQTFGITIVPEPLMIGEEYWQGFMTSPSLYDPVRRIATVE